MKIKIKGNKKCNPYFEKSFTRAIKQYLSSLDYIDYEIEGLL